MQKSGRPTSAIKIKRAGVEGQAPAGVAFESFVGLTADPNIDEKIAAKEREVGSSPTIRSAQGTRQSNRTGFAGRSAEFEALLGRTLSDLSADAERRVAAHLAAHEMGKTGERWVQEGLEYIRAEAYPFCNQPPLQGVDLIGPIVPTSVTLTTI